MCPLMRFLFNLRHVRETNGGSKSEGIVLIIDEQTGIAPEEVCRLLQIWQDWLSVDAVLVRSAPLEPDDLRREVSVACRIIGVVTDQDDFLTSVQHVCQALGAVCIHSGLPVISDAREVALCQEATHHDFEIGGFDEWSGQPTRWAHHILQHLSRTNCERLFPQFLLPYIQRFQGPDKNPVETLDIGCGPVSVLRWGALQGLLRVTGVDPLLDMYRMILERHGLDGLPAIACQRELNMLKNWRQYSLPRALDIVFTRNAIDHVGDPVAVIGQAEACLRPGGILVLDFHTREGSRQGWEQLHQFDLYLDETDQLVCQTQQGVRHLLIAAGLGLFVRQIVAKTEDVTVVILEKGEKGESVVPQHQDWITEWKQGEQCLEEQTEPRQDIAEERERVVQEQQAWISELERGRTWLEEQVQEQQAWIGELERGRTWLEEQVQEQQAWIGELERGRAWLEEQVQEQQAWIGELERGRAWLEEERTAWQDIAEERERVVQEHQAWIGELERGRTWLEEQRTAWQTQAEYWQTSFWGRLGRRLKLVNPAQELSAKVKRGQLIHFARFGPISIWLSLTL